MKHFKRPLAWLLSLSMVASYLPPSFAQEKADSAQIQEEIPAYTGVLSETVAQGESQGSVIEVATKSSALGLSLASITALFATFSDSVEQWKESYETNIATQYDLETVDGSETESLVILLDGKEVTANSDGEYIVTIPVEVNEVSTWTPPVATVKDDEDQEVTINTQYGYLNTEKETVEYPGDYTEEDLKTHLSTAGNRGVISYSAEDIEVIVWIVSYEGLYVEDGLLKLVFDDEIHDPEAEVEYSMDNILDLVNAIRVLSENIEAVDGAYTATVSSLIGEVFEEVEFEGDPNMEFNKLLLMANSTTRVEFTYFVDDSEESIYYDFKIIGGCYNIISEETENGSFYVGSYFEEDRDYFKTELSEAKEELKVFATPDEGYEVDSISVVDSEGGEVELDEENGFTMPESDVTVTVVFQKVYKITLDPNYESTKNRDYDDVESEIMETSGRMLPELTGLVSIPGYTFSHWCLDQNGTDNPEYRVTNQTEFSEDSTLYAIWTPYVITITFMNGTDTFATISTTYGEKLEEIAPATDDPMNEFKGWYEEDTFVSKVDEDTIATGNVTYYGKWEIKTYTVEFDVEEYQIEDQIVDHGSKVDEPELTLDEGEIVSWYIINEYDDEQIWSFDTAITSDMTIYARITVATYEVIFFKNDGGSGTFYWERVEHGEVVDEEQFPTTDPTRTGYTFLGWSTNENQDPDEFGDDDAWDFSTTITDTLRIYAVWDAQKFTITFKQTGDMTVDVVVSDVPYDTLTDSSKIPTPENGDFSFLGWYTEEGLENLFDPSTDTVKNNLELFAKWSEPYTITYTVNEVEKTLETGADGKLTALPDAPENTDSMQEWKGWFDENGVEVTTDYQFTGDSVITAEWYQLYTITFVAGEGGSLSMTDATEPFEFITGTDGKIDATDLTATPDSGYKFLAWLDDATEEVDLGGVFEADSTITATFYAYYTITLISGDNGTVTPESVETNEEGKITDSILSDLTKTAEEGYEFGGWFLDLADDTTEVDSSTVFDFDTNIYALWVEIEETPDDENPDGENPDGENPDGENPDGENPDGENPDVENPDVENPDGEDLDDEELDDEELDDEELDDEELDDEDLDDEDLDDEDLDEEDLDDEDLDDEDLDDEDLDDEDLEDEDLEGEDDTVPESYTLMGKVTDSTGEDLEGITITLKRNGTTYESVTSNSYGNYYLEKTYSGYYYLIFDDGTVTKTISINLSSDSTSLPTIAMPSHKISTESSISTRTMVQTVAGLDTLADLMSLSEKSAVTLSMEILASTPEETQELIENVVGRDNEVGAYFEVSLYKRSYSDEEVASEVEITETESLLQLVLEIPSTYRGKENYYIYRLHDNDLDIITTSANSQNERIVLSEDGTTLTVYTRNFSTYAFVYEKDDVTSTGPATGTTYPIIIERLADGDVSTSATVGTVGFSNSNPAAGALVTVTPYPGTGYQVDSVSISTADGSSLNLIDRGDGSYTFTQGSSIVTVTVAFISTDSIPNQYSLFSDVKITDEYCHAINKVVEMGVMTGTTANTFSPNDSLTRGMIVTILYRLSGNNSYGSGQFVDVYPTDYYYNAVAWAKELGIVSGYVDGTFRPGQNVTREELAVIFDSYCDKMNLASYVWLFPSQFVDNQVIGAWASNSVAFCTNLGIMDGKEDYFHPAIHATRGEVAMSLLALAQF